MHHYVDDIVVKTREKDTLIKDLEETFANLRKVNIKLNPAKCVFGSLQANSSGSWCLIVASKQTPTRSRP